MRKRKYGIVYKATNKINNKVYIGQTWRYLSERIWNHTHHSGCTLFYNALMKYKLENFVWEVLFKSDRQDILDIEEDKLIKLHKSNNKEFGYNLRLGGSCGKFSEESKDKMRKSTLRYFKNKEARIKHGKIQKLRFSNFEERIKHSRAHGGKPFYGRKGDEIKIFKTQVEAASYVCSSQGCIKSALKGIVKEVKGWIFSYEEIKEYKSLKHIKNKMVLARRTDSLKLIKFNEPGWTKTLASIWRIHENCARVYLKRNFPDIFKSAYNPRTQIVGSSNKS
jgi:group I intron endonuclease